LANEMAGGTGTIESKEMAEDHLMNVKQVAASLQKKAPVEQTVESAADRLWNVTETAQFLGVEPTSLYHMVSRHSVPCIHLSKRCLRFRRSDLEAWIATKKSKP
jgi:predicted DNA-binding transcriptional regulator AlpA